MPEEDSMFFAKDLATLLWSFGQLKTRPDDALSNLLEKEAMLCCGGLSAQGVSMIIFSAGKLNWVSDVLSFPHLLRLKQYVSQSFLCVGRLIWACNFLSFPLLLCLKMCVTDHFLYRIAQLGATGSVAIRAVFGSSFVCVFPSVSLSFIKLSSIWYVVDSVVFFSSALWHCLQTHALVSFLHC